MDVYVAADDFEPTQFKNDFEFKGQLAIKLSSAAMPGVVKFLAAVRVNSVQYNGNVYRQGTLKSTFKLGTTQMKYIQPQDMEQIFLSSHELTSKFDSLVEESKKKSETQGKDIDNSTLFSCLLALATITYLLNRSKTSTLASN